MSQRVDPPAAEFLGLNRDAQGTATRACAERDFMIGCRELIWVSGALGFCKACFSDRELFLVYRMAACLTVDMKRPRWNWWNRGRCVTSDLLEPALGHPSQTIIFMRTEIRTSAN